MLSKQETAFKFLLKADVYVWKASTLVDECSLHSNSVPGHRSVQGSVSSEILSNPNE